jgi:hypothetical protein
VSPDADRTIMRSGTGGLYYSAYMQVPVAPKKSLNKKSLK